MMFEHETIKNVVWTWDHQKGDQCLHNYVSFPQSVFVFIPDKMKTGIY